MNGKILDVYEEAMEFLRRIAKKYNLSSTEVEKASKIIKEYLSNTSGSRLPEPDNLVIGAVSIIREDLQSILVEEYGKPSSTISTIKTRIRERVNLSEILNNSHNIDINRIIKRLEKIEKEIKELIEELKNL